MPGGNHIHAVGGKILLSLNYSITGGATRHYLSGNEGNIESGQITITLTGTPAFTTFAESTFGLISLYVPTFVGAATGTRYYIVYNAFLNTFAGVTLPGNVAGISGAGGQVA